MKKLLNLISVACLCQNMLASVSEDQLLVHMDGENNFHIQPWFQNIQPDLLHLIKRSYVVTKRDSEHDFIHEDRMLNGKSNFVVDETGHTWYCDRNFTGTHGKIEQSSCFGRMLNCCLECCTAGAFSAEIDFPGFVALMNPTDNCPHYVISVVFRGSQGEDFQPGSGMLSASWATNYDAEPRIVQANKFGFEGKLHEGYTTKFLSCNASYKKLAKMIDNGEIINPLISRRLIDFVYPLNYSIERIISMIPQEEQHNVRFVVIGHSQGGGLAHVAFPYIIKQFGNSIPGFIDNKKTPCFFGYFLSSPRVAADGETADNYSDFVGRDNVINHFAFRDIVAMACLNGYLPLGHLACDSAYDVLYRGICSEIAHNNRILLMQFFRRHIHQEFFNTSDENYWIYRDTPELIICWKEIKAILSCVHFDFTNITQEFILKLLNDALQSYRQKRNIDSDVYFDETNTFLIDNLDWERIQEICEGDLAPEEIQLDQERCDVLKRVEANISGETVSFSRDGRFNVPALIDTVLDFMDATRDTHNLGGCLEYLKRIFCCSCCCADELEVDNSFFFDPNFKELVNGNLIDPIRHKITPSGNIPIFAYLHYGTSANASGEKLFDKYLPSRNLYNALQNGRILSQENNIVLNSLQH